MAPSSVTTDFGPLFEPRVIAVVGASLSGRGAGNRYIRTLRDYGYDGEIIAVHPSSDTVEGLPAYPSLAAIPKGVDYAYIAVPAKAVPDVLGAAGDNVRFAQVLSSGFGETLDGAYLEDALVRAAIRGGVRVIGPNCLGTFSPRGHVTFVERSPREVGTIGVISQSGGLGADIVRRGKNRGLRFRGLVTVGNSADIDPNDILEFYLADANTKIIGLYLESIADGRRLSDLLLSARGMKPIVLLKGGRTGIGLRAAASHTGAMVSDDRVWKGLARQAGVTLVQTLDELLGALLALQMLAPHETPTRSVVLFGNGGGTSVLASDSFASMGFDIPLLQGAVAKALAALNLPAGASIQNPIDTPAGGLLERGRDIFGEVLEILIPEGYDAVILHLNLAVVLSNDGGGVDLANMVVRAAQAARSRCSERTHILLVLRSDGEPDVEDVRREISTEATTASIPVFRELHEAARALNALRVFEAARIRRRGLASSLLRTQARAEA